MKLGAMTTGWWEDLGVVNGVDQTPWLPATGTFELD